MHCKVLSFGVLALTLCTALAPASAISAPLLGQPAANAIVASTPTFSFDIPAGETDFSIDVAPSPELNEYGSFAYSTAYKSFYDEPLLRSWTPTTALHAGSYWWKMKSTDASYAQLSSEVRAFTIPARHTMVGLTARVQKRLWIRSNLTLISNVKEPSLKVTVRRGKKVISRRTTPLYISTSEIGQPYTVPFTTYPPGGYIKKKTRFTIQATVSGGGQSTTITKTIRA